MQSDTPAPDPPPEAVILRVAREATGMTAGQAAEATEGAVSATYWRDVERGYGGRRGKQAKARASSRYLAHMARVVSLTPEQLTEAGRDDAARVLSEILRREHVPDPAPPPADSDYPAAALEGITPGALAPFVQSVRDDFAAAVRKYGMEPAGAQVFGTGYEAAVWDRHSLSTEDREELIAIFRLFAELGVPEQEEDSGDGEGRNAVLCRTQVASLCNCHYLVTSRRISAGNIAFPSSRK